MIGPASLQRPEAGAESDDTGSADLSLRDRKKARQRAELLRVALELFRQDGFDKARMEDIAARAMVSTPTVYNYFTNKREVLIEILIEDRRLARDAFERVVMAPPPEPADAFAALMYNNMRNIRRAEDKRLWRELLAAVAKTHDSDRDPFDANHDVFKAYIKRLLTHYVGAGRISEGVPLDLAADLIFAINSQNLRHLVASQSCTPKQIMEMAREQIALLIMGWESAPRVKAKAGGARAPRKKKQP